MKPNLWAVTEFLQLHLDDDNFKERFPKKPLRTIPGTLTGDGPDGSLEEPQRGLRIERREAMKVFRELLVDAPS